MPPVFLRISQHIKSENRSIFVDRVVIENKQVMERETIIRYLAARKPEFKKKFGVKRIGLFGSYALGRNHKDSDIDIVVELEKPDLLTLVGIKQMIEEDLDIEVDVVRNRERMNRALKKRIERDAVYV